MNSSKDTKTQHPLRQAVRSDSTADGSWYPTLKTSENSTENSCSDESGSAWESAVILFGTCLVCEDAAKRDCSCGPHQEPSEVRYKKPLDPESNDPSICAQSVVVEMLRLDFLQTSMNVANISVTQPEKAARPIKPAFTPTDKRLECGPSRPAHFAL